MIQTGVNGVLFDFFNADALAELANQLLDRKDEYRVLGRQGAAIIRERYSIDICLPKMVAMYESVKRTRN
jgi:glycosyltransferase involved in cell wall biosynthesis